MECGHSSIREYTKARGRGHAANLAEVSAKSVCRFISKHHSFVEAKEQFQEEAVFPAPPPATRGGGGAWRAFLSDKCQGVKLSREVVRNKRIEFRQLSPEEYAHFHRIGAALTAQHRYKALRAQNLQVETIEPTEIAKVVVPSHDALAAANPSFLVDGDDFDSRFSSFCQIVHAEQKQKRMDKLAAKTVDDPTTDGSQDLAAQELARSGGPGFVQGLRHAPTGQMVLDHFHWKLPMVQFLKACLHEKSRLEGQMRLSDLVTLWKKDHELLQHEQLDTLQPGPAKQFPVSSCAKLGTCVCGPDGKKFILMWSKLREHIKGSHPGTQKEPSPELVRYRDGLLVLELASEEIQDLQPPGRDRETGLQVIYLHVGFTNFSTWETACTRLHVRFYNPFTGS